MSYDPNQPPDSGYGTPPFGTPAQGPYGASQNHYHAPQNPSGTPAQAEPYSTPPQSSNDSPVYQQQGNAPPLAAPLPLMEVIRQLPSQYIRVLTKPSAATFAEEMGKAAWNSVWVQLIGLAVIAAVLAYLGYLIDPGRFGGSSSLSPETHLLFVLGGTLGNIVSVPVFFFIFVGILYRVAKAFGGQGTFLAQGYTYLLLIVPIGIISSVLNLVPVVGFFASFALGIYALVLNVFSLMALHRFSGGKATAVLFIAIGVLIVVGIVISIIIAVIVAPSIRPA